MRYWQRDRLQVEHDWTVRRALVVGVGVLVTIAGVIFAVQGLGYLHGSAMTGTTMWKVLGPVIAVCGLGIIALGFRTSRR